MKCCGEVSPAQYHCPLCHNSFTSLENFDRHQDVDYDRDPALACRAPETLGLVQGPRGTWMTPQARESMTQRTARLAAAQAARDRNRRRE